MITEGGKCITTSQWKLKQWSILVNTLSIRYPTAPQSLLAWCWEAGLVSVTSESKRDVELRLQSLFPFFLQQSLSTWPCSLVRSMGLLRNIQCLVNAEYKCLEIPGLWDLNCLQNMRVSWIHSTANTAMLLGCVITRFEAFLQAKVLVNPQILNGH